MGMRRGTPEPPKEDRSSRLLPGTLALLLAAGLGAVRNGCRRKVHVTLGTPREVTAS